jgi:hypothetical protein
VLQQYSPRCCMQIAMCSGPALPLRTMLQALQVLRGVPGVLEHAIGCLSALSLRHPANAQTAVDAGALALVARCMESHPASSAVQRAGCLAIRNLIVKSPQRIALAVDEGEQ